MLTADRPIEWLSEIFIQMLQLVERFAYSRAKKEPINLKARAYGFKGRYATVAEKNGKLKEDNNLRNTYFDLLLRGE